jgi:hypothetical protein
VTTDLWNQGVQKIENLKGKRIGITQTGSTYHYMIGRLLEEKGLSLGDVQLVELGKLGALTAALQSKQVDAVILNEPNITSVVKAGYGKMLAQVGAVPFDSLMIVLHHHENADGSGYPHGLAGTAIPLSARLMALADVYDALISKRVYKPAFPHEQAKAIIVEGRAAHFDPDVVDAFLASEQRFIAIAREFADEYTHCP